MGKLSPRSSPEQFSGHRMAESFPPMTGANSLRWQPAHYFTAKAFRVLLQIAKCHNDQPALNRKRSRVHAPLGGTVGCWWPKAQDTPGAGNAVFSKADLAVSARLYYHRPDFHPFKTSHDHPETLPGFAVRGDSGRAG